jgi:hypothetical protein
MAICFTSDRMSSFDSDDKEEIAAARIHLRQDGLFNRWEDIHDFANLKGQQIDDDLCRIETISCENRNKKVTNMFW